MSLSIKHQGEYRLYETPDRRRQIMVLDNRAFDWLSGSREDVLMLTDTRPQPDTLIGEGRYLIVYAQREPGWQDDTDYLALSDGEESYYLYKLRYGLPTDRRQQKPLAAVNRILEAGRLKATLEAS